MGIIVKKKIAPQNTHTLGCVSPYLLGPELPLLENILQEVTDDVCLLQEQAHGIGQSRVLAHHCVLHSRRREESRQADANQTRHIMTVLQTQVHRVSTKPAT